MAIEKRDSVSHAKLFIPSKTEKAIRSQREKLSKELKEVEKLKKELQSLIKELKKEKN